MQNADSMDFSVARETAEKKQRRSDDNDVELLKPLHSF